MNGGGAVKGDGRLGGGGKGIGAHTVPPIIEDFGVTPSVLVRTNSSCPIGACFPGDGDPNGGGDNCGGRPGLGFDEDTVPCSAPNAWGPVTNVAPPPEWVLMRIV